MAKTKSGKKSLIRLFAIVLVGTLLCVLFSGAYSTYISEQQMTYCNEAALNLYFGELQSIMENLESFNENLFGNNRDFLSLSMRSDRLSEIGRLQARNNLRTLFQSRISAPTAILMIRENGSLVDYQFGGRFHGGIMNLDFMDLMRKIGGNHINNNNEQKWTIYSENDNAILVNSIRRNDLYVCSMIDLRAFSDIHYSESDTITYSFFNESEILTNKTFADHYEIGLSFMHNAANQIVRLNRFHFLLQSQYDPVSGIGLCGIISITGIWDFLRGHLMIQTTVLALISIMFAFMYSNMSRMLIYPLNQIMKTTKQIAESSTYKVEPQENDLLEFQQIRGALQQLVEQRVHLEQDNLEQAFEKEHAQLQYYQLQTRSHFFINCLKSIYNLTERGEQEKTKRIITLFSNHLRYVFHDNLSLVALKAELDEVNDYYRIISLERKDPILLSQNVDPMLMNVQVPPLCIQLFLENFHKLSLQNGKILRFLIHVDAVELEDREFIRIRLSDNGPGYSQEALTKLGSTDRQYEQYQVGIQNLKRRMSLIYQNDYRIAFFNSPSGGAVTVMYIPMKKGEQE